MSWAERTSNATKTPTPVVKVAPVTTTVEMIRVRNKITGVVKDVPKGTPLWMDELVPGDTPLSDSPTVASAPSVVSTSSKAQPTLVEKEVEIEPEVVHKQGVDYPFGFDSYQEFRDKTRIIAEQARNGIVIVSGSSVTGRSFKTGKPFHTGGHITENSDIDVGIVDSNLYYDGSQVNERGFPVPRTSLGNAEILERVDNYKSKIMADAK